MSKSMLDEIRNWFRPSDGGEDITLAPDCPVEVTPTSL